MSAQPTHAASVLTVLRDGPATTGEVAAELGWNPKLAFLHLRQHMRRGRVSRERFPGKRVRWLWRLAAHDKTDREIFPNP